jgi:anti-sigma regulatory factor (Ser/Thr protein kinase)
MSPQASNDSPYARAEGDALHAAGSTADPHRNASLDEPGRHCVQETNTAVIWRVHEPDTGILADWSIPRSVDYVSEARGHVRKLAETVFGYGDRSHDVAVCASETIGNAVRHGGGQEIQIIVSADASCLSVEVTDDGSGGIPHPCSDAAESGRGLLIVEALADRWGHVVDDDTGQLSVSFDFDIKPSPVQGTHAER